MKERILSNWKTSLIGAILFLFSGVLLWLGKITFAEFSAFLPVVIGLICAKDDFLSKFISKAGIIVFLTLGISSCHPTKYIPLTTETIVKDRLVPVQIPADSSSIFALLECDSMNHVIMKQLSDRSSNYVVQNVRIDSNRLVVKTIYMPGEVSVLVHDSIINRDVPYPVAGKDIITHDLYWWQETLIWLGGIVLIISIIYFIIKLK